MEDLRQKYENFIDDIIRKDKDVGDYWEERESYYKTIPFEDFVKKESKKMNNISGSTLYDLLKRPLTLGVRQDDNKNLELMMSVHTDRGYAAVSVPITRTELEELSVAITKFLEKTNGQ